MYNGTMAREITIDASGRLVIPKAIRTRQRLTPGTRLELVEEEDRLVLVPRHADSVTEERGGLILLGGKLRGEIPDHRDLRRERLDHLAGLGADEA